MLAFLLEPQSYVCCAMIAHEYPEIGKVYIEVVDRYNLLVRIHFIIVMIRWTGLVAWIASDMTDSGAELHVIAHEYPEIGKVYIEVVDRYLLLLYSRNRS